MADDYLDIRLKDGLPMTSDGPRPQAEINSRYAHIPDDGPNWQILDSDMEWDEFPLPKKFAATAELAVELLEYVTAKQQIAINSGFESGRKLMQ